MGLDDAERRPTSTSRTPRRRPAGRLVFSEPRGWTARRRRAASSRSTRPTGTGLPRPAGAARRSARPTARPRRAATTAPRGKGAGGRLRYQLDIPTGGSATLWIAVAGSEAGPARGDVASWTPALADPDAALASKMASREQVASRHAGRPSGRPAARAGHRVEQAEPGRLRAVGRRPAGALHRRGQAVPAARRARSRTCASSAPGSPTTRGCSRPTASSPRSPRWRLGQFETIADHLRALRDVSVIVNPTSGKVVHEVVTDGSVYYGADSSAGNTDETAKFPSALALAWRWSGDSGPARPAVSVRGARHALGRRSDGRRRRRLAGGSRQRGAHAAWARRSST